MRSSSSAPRVRLAALVVAAGLVLAACGGGSDADTTSPTGAVDAAAGGAGPLGFVADTVDGGSLDGSTLVGTDTIAWFWAPW